MNAIEQMAGRLVSAPTASPKVRIKQKPPRYVKRTDASIITYCAYQEEIRRGILVVLQRHRRMPISQIRALLSQGFFVGTEPASQAAEISAAMKHLLKDGFVRRNDCMPYVWEAI
jgi:hypothetical protein